MDIPSGTEHFDIHYVPSDEVIPAIRDAIHKGEEALKKTEGRIEELRQELRALEERREVQKREVNKRKNLLAPTQRVNVDILMSIFLLVSDVDHLQISANHPAVVISHVCRRWRDVALATKQLWRHLHIQLPAYPWSSSSNRDIWRAEITKLVTMTKAWISRSDGCHLSVEVTDGDLPPGQVEAEIGAFVTECIEFRELVRLLCSSSPRWKDLCLRCDFPQAQLPNFPTMRLLAVPPQSTPTLTTVKLHCRINTFQQKNPLNKRMVSSTNILSAPTLRSLRIDARLLCHDLMRIPVVWSNLEHLFFNGYPLEFRHRLDAEQALALFRECPNLVTCYLALQTDGTIALGRAPVTLQRLRELAFLPSTSHLPKGFAQFLILPSLRKLEVITGYGKCTPREYQESGLFEFFERFGSNLENATFCYRPLTQAALHRCLGHLPNVTSLGLVSEKRGGSTAATGRTAKLNSDIFRLLSPQFHETGTTVTQLPLCPGIEVFRFGAFGGEADEEALVDFIETRRRGVKNQSLQNGVAHLREVECNRYRFEAINPGQALRDRGIDMEAFSLTNWYDCTL